VAQWFLFRDCGLAGAPRWFHSKTGSRVDVVLKRQSIAYLCVLFPLMVFSLRLQGHLQAWAASPVPVLPIPQLSQTIRDAKDIFV